ncbi:MAG: hypothetical protein HY286_19045 [Planctomycetes bacterium]|nr:hypothetical protein [Planctomycetota bacterium]
MFTKPPTVNGVHVPYGAAVAELSDIIKTPGPGAWAAFVALGFHESREALNVLIDSLSSGDATIRRAAVAAIRFHRDGRSAEGHIAVCMRDSDRAVSVAAVETAGFLKLIKLHGQILEFIHSSDAGIRARAVRAFEKVWASGDFDRVLELMLKDPDEGVRRESAMILFSRAEAENWRALFELWKNDPLPRHRVFACELLQKFEAPLARELAPQFLNDPNGHVRGAARRAMGI